MRRGLLILMAAGLLSTATGCYLMCGICDCDPPGPGYGLPHTLVAPAAVGNATVVSKPAPATVKPMPAADR